MNEAVVKLRCPKCKEVLRVKRPSVAGVHQYSCPYCQQAFRVNIKADDEDERTKVGVSADVSRTASSAQSTETKIVSANTHKPVLRLYRKRRFRSDESYDLKMGSNLIGCQDNDAPSDIMVRDSFVSRRSVSIAVEMVEPGEFDYVFTLLRTTNPVSLNGKEIQPGTTVFLYDGDEFVLGRTVFYMRKNESNNQ